MKSDDLQIIACDKKSGMFMIEIFEVEPKCSFCGSVITEENFGGMFSKPTKVCCDNICCLMEVFPFEG